MEKENTEAVSDNQNNLKPISSIVTPNTINFLSNDAYVMLEEKCFNGGKSSSHYNEINYIFNNVKDIDSSIYTTMNNMGLSKNKVENSVAFIDAITYKMVEISKELSVKNVFINVIYQLKDDEGVEKDIISYEIDDINLANYIYNTYYKDRVFISHLDSEKNNPYYMYDEHSKLWRSDVGKSTLCNEIKHIANTLVRCLGYDTRSRKYNQQRIVDEIIPKIQYVSDDNVSMLETFSLTFPHWVQFKDLVYDMKNHRVAKMSAFFKLNHYHNYTINTGLNAQQMDELLNKDSRTLDKMVLDFNFSESDLDDSDSTINQLLNTAFVDVPITEQEVVKKSQNFIRRIEMNTTPSEFIMSVIGNMFYHDTKWLVNLFIVGPQGDGKSWIWNLISKKLFSNTGAALKQKQIDSDSRFTENGLLYKEFNLIGEFKGVVMTKAFIDFIKSTLSDYTTYEVKGGKIVSTKFYANLVALANKGQLPYIATSDVNDGGLQRRIVVLECDGNKEYSKHDFTENQLSKEVPSFVMACMMKLMKHMRNGDIDKFQSDEYTGCVNKHIEGFTTKDMVKTTRDYFKSHDRYRKFFLYLGELFFQQVVDVSPYKEVFENEKSFKKWLEGKSANDIKDYYMYWHNEEFEGKTTKEKFENHLRTTYNIEQQRKRIKVDGKSKQVRTYGDEFTDLVVSVILEEMPDLFSSD